MTIKILFVDKPETALLEEIRQRHQDDLEGLDELYEELIQNGTCQSSKSYLIYYLAYTLGLQDIELTLVKLLS